jgi:hypothetical protein
MVDVTAGASVDGDGEWGAIVFSQHGCSGIIALGISVEITKLRNIVAGRIRIHKEEEK